MFKNTVCILAILLLLPSFRLNADQIKPKSRPFAGLTDHERDVIKKEVVKTTLQNELQGSRYRIFGIQSTPVKHRKELADMFTPYFTITLTTKLIT
jgi:hypothetical protein